MPRNKEKIKRKTIIEGGKKLTVVVESEEDLEEEEKAEEIIRSVLKDASFDEETIDDLTKAMLIDMKAQKVI